ncbi:putative structural protein [Bacillus phage PBC2]|uniref:Putative structural protein n=1 Tax=Bacillus phage PBC2 TaxID=1675029 RepID=A0A218KCC4_9CAUD|nr:putative structural protein [Bacillus phage PBC2]AKQ08530.1 putative structural protein [Bacillus phage PBC2]
MSHIDKYRRRLNRSGKDVGEVYKNNTIAFIEATFHKSPTFRVLEVISTEFPDIKTMDSRVVEVERMGTLREVIFRPNQSLGVGTYVKFDGDTWLLFDKYGGTGSTSVKMLAQKCNRSLKWKDESGVFHEFECVAGATDLGSKAKQSKNDIYWNKYDVRLPIGQLFVFVELNDTTKHIRLNQRFIFGGNVYEVIGIDDTTAISRNGFGLMQFTIRLTTKQEKDDFDAGIAFNDYKEKDSIFEPPVDNDGGDPW